MTEHTEPIFSLGMSLTIGNATRVLEQGLCAIESGQLEIDLGTLLTVDSSAVAVMLVWQRAALKRASTLIFKRAPDAVCRLIALYGVTNLLSVVPAEANK